MTTEIEKQAVYVTEDLYWRAQDVLAGFGKEAEEYCDRTITRIKFFGDNYVDEVDYFKKIRVVIYYLRNSDEYSVSIEGRTEKIQKVPEDEYFAALELTEEFGSAAQIQAMIRASNLRDAGKDDEEEFWEQVSGHILARDQFGMRLLPITEEEESAFYARTKHERNEPFQVTVNKHRYEIALDLKEQFGKDAKTEAQRKQREAWDNMQKARKKLEEEGETEEIKANLRHWESAEGWWYVLIIEELSYVLYPGVFEIVGFEDE